MTENLPAVRETGRHAVAAPVDTDSWVNVAAPIMRLAETIAETEFVPKALRTKAACAAAMLYGREVGLAPLTSLNMMHVVEGKPGLSAEGMRALIFAGGHEIEVTQSTGAVCVMRGRRRGSESWSTVEWTIDMARAAGLTGKNNWKHYPRALLQARCTTELARLIFPDVIHGFRSVEELEDMADVGDDEAPGSAASTGTSVQRAKKRAAAKKSAAELPAGSPAPAADGPPLPGEPGFDGHNEPEPESQEQEQARPPAPEPEGSGEPAADSDSSGDPEGSGEPSSRGGEVLPSGSPTSDDEPEGAEDPRDDNGELEDVVEAEVVGETPEGEQPRVTTSPPRLISRAQLRMVHAKFNDLGLKGDEFRDERLDAISKIIGTEVDSSAKVTLNDARGLIDTLALVQDLAGLRELLAGLDESGEQS